MVHALTFVCIDPGLLQLNVDNTELRYRNKYCFFNDDVWLSGYLRRKGVGLLVMPGIRGGRQFRHPTLSLSVRPDYEHTDMDPCIRFWEGGTISPG